jgi:hypothetical protein
LIFKQIENGFNRPSRNWLRAICLIYLTMSAIEGEADESRPTRLKGQKPFWTKDFGSTTSAT